MSRNYWISTTIMVSMKFQTKLMVISRWFRCCAKLSIDFLKVSSWPNENFIGTVNDIVAIWADFPNTTLTVWKTANAPKTESAKEQPLMQRIRKFSIRWNPLESRCSRIEQDKTGQWNRRSGPKGRRFKSCHLDQFSRPDVVRCPVFFCVLHKNSDKTG